MSKNKETRIYEADIEVRMDGDKNTVRGYAAVFNKESHDLGGFIEVIEPGAFSNVLTDDVRALIDHKSELILGRTESGTLRIGEDEVGLWYEYDSPNTSYANDLLESMKRGDVTQSSFGFSVNQNGQKWEKRGDKMYRSITGVSKLFDVSPVTYPAYPDTSVAARSLDKLNEEKTAILEADKVDRDKIIRQLDLNIEK